MIGLSGAQRTGKTTLARAFAEQAGIPYLAVSGAPAFTRLGLDPKVDYDFTTRLLVQREILSYAAALYRSAGGQRFITDRTPIDMMSYLAADVQRENVVGADAEDFRRYILDCFDVLNHYFNVVIIVQPGIPLVDEEGKAPANVAHMEHINALAMGFAIDERFHGNHYYIPRKHLTVESRLACLRFVDTQIARKHATHLEALREQGRSLVTH